MKNEISKLRCLYELFPDEIAYAIRNIPETERSCIQEIRLRRGRRLTVKLFSKEYFVSSDGRLMNSPERAVNITDKAVETVFQRAYGSSVHSHKREIAAGYITVGGGSRAGFCGTAILNPSLGYRVESIKDISSVNIRVAREIIGCADEIYKRVFSDGIKSLLIAGPPSSGKTTVLRDLTRILGEKYSISLIDERNEIAACANGVVQNSVGSLTDVFCSYNKYEGIMTAVKVMSPEILICDEIGSKEDYEALEYALNSGIKLIATCHASGYSELKRKSVISKLLKEKVFDYCAVLGTGAVCGKLVSLSVTGEKND